MIARAEDAEKLNRKLHVDLTTAQARVAALESREVIAVEALKQAKNDQVQKLMEAYLVTHNQRRALRIQEPAPSNPVQPIKAEDPQILEGHPVSTKGEKKAWELLEGTIVLEGISVFPQAMDKKEHHESSQDPPPELFEPLTMKKILAPSLESRKKLQAPRQHRRPLRSYKSQSSLKKSSTASCHLSLRQKKSSTSAPS
ncbi:hypothetical protein Zm00014a_035814 [Zea mays]|uniref:Uncharacterized protein n=1 Tax=Zea mays TaxID=4577 RepID=A0A317Y1A5_MAIZE|nr:hypothetical protein Zm00014a_035814 [Zea mays]